MVALRSFDVFDTVVTRRVAEPTSAFIILGDRLCSSGKITVSPEVFARVRMAVKRQLSSTSASGEVTLREVAEVLARRLELPDRMVSELVNAELELERELLVAVPGIRSALDDARRSSTDFAFISDTYLPQRFINEVLTEFGLRRPTDHLFVSCEVGASKVRRTLYEHVMRDLGYQASAILHTGDDPHADVKAPRSFGMHVEHAVACRPTRYEQALEEHRWESGALSSVLAGASRLARLRVSARSEEERVIRDVAAGVVSPLLVGYVLWVLRRARAQSLERLYFVARDGEILLDIARRLDATLGFNLDLRYLYGSRQSWFPAGADPEQPIEALDLLSHDVDMSTVGLLQRCGVDPSAWVDPLVDDRPDGGEEVVARLKVDQQFLSAVSEGIVGRQERLERHLRGAGMFDPVPYGVVDLGWRGLALHHLSRLLEKRGTPAPLGLYMALDSDAPRRQPTACWLDGMRDGVRAFMVETFCAGTHGQVVDFDAAADGSTHPVLLAPENGAAIRWGLPVLRETVAEFTDAFAESAPSVRLDGDVRAAATEVFRLFYEAPTQPEARVWGAFPYELDLASGRHAPLAKARTIRAVLRDRMRSNHIRLRWPAGSETLSSRPWRISQQLLRDPRRVARRFRRLVRLQR